MSFTQDELQAFNTILEQKLSIHRRDLERTFDQRMYVLRREFEQRLTTFQQDITHRLLQRLAERQDRLYDTLSQKLDRQQTHVMKALNHETAQSQRQFKGLVEHALAAQLLAIEQIISQQIAPSSLDLSPTYMAESHSDVETIEVQTEVSWEDLGEIVGGALSEHFSALNESMQNAIKNMEHRLSAQLHDLREQLLCQQSREDLTNLQGVFAGIEQLEHVVESMQVAMTTNHALLSNRLHNHQQLPLDRAHSLHPPSVSSNEDF